MHRMAELGVETRPVFFCAHHMPMYEQADTFPVAQDVAARGISLPSFPGIDGRGTGQSCELRSKRGY